MLLLFIIWLLCFALVIPLSFYIHWREVRKIRLQFRFSEAWRRARLERRRWLEENSFILNPFADPEYESLWLREIGAEMLLNIHGLWTGAASYDEYLAEKARFSMF